MSAQLEKLLKEELVTINGLLYAIRECERTYTLCFVGSMLGLVALPVLAGVYWLLGFREIHTEGIVELGVLLVSALGIGGWSFWKSSRHFDQLRVRCAKLNRAGLILYKRQAFLRDEIAAAEAAPPDGALVIDADSLSRTLLREHLL